MIDCLHCGNLINSSREIDGQETCSILCSTDLFLNELFDLENVNDLDDDANEKAPSGKLEALSNTNKGKTRN